MNPILAAFQNFYDRFPFSISTVAIFLGLCAISLFIAFREFWAWYSKVSILKAEMHEVRESLLRIEKTLDKMRESDELQAEPFTPPQAIHEKPEEHFPLLN